MVQVVESFTVPSMMSSAKRSIVDAQGIRLKFADGVSAICATSGLWNVSFGYGNVCIAKHLERALHSLHYATLFRYSNEYAEHAAQLLTDAVGDNYQAVIYATSGSSLNDAAVKFARQTAALKGEMSRRLIVTFKGSYHGMTMSSMALTGEALGQSMYSVDTRFVRHLSIEDHREWEHFFERYGNQVALVILEPMLGSGVFLPSSKVLETICELRREYDFLLMSDEVATGFYKLGPFAACMQWPCMPDLIGFSKALTNGTVASSMLVISKKAWSIFVERDCPFMHGETQAGSPVSAAATVGVFEYMGQCRVEQCVNHVSHSISSICENLAVRYNLVHRGRGLFHFLGWGNSSWWNLLMDKGIRDPIWHVVDFFRDRGIVVQPSIKGIQIIPQIVSTDKDLFLIEEALGNAFDDLSAGYPWE